HRCSSCGLVFADQREVPADLYEKAYAPGSEYQCYLSLDTGKTTGRVRAAWAWKQFRRISGRGRRRRILDVGCSTGAFLTYAKGQGWDVVGLDVSEKAAELARAN